MYQALPHGYEPDSIKTQIVAAIGEATGPAACVTISNELSSDALGVYSGEQGMTSENVPQLPTSVYAVVRDATEAGEKRF